MAKEATYNPYKQALNMLQEKLDLDKIPLVKSFKDNKLISLIEEGFDSDRLKKWLTNFQRNGFKPHRTIKQMSGYEILQCPRQSYYNRVNALYDQSKVAQYPFSTIKATMGNIIEQLVLSMYNQTEGTKFRNGVNIHWKTNEEFGTLYPIAGVIDGLSYDEDIILDVKFTDQYDDFHMQQVKLYALAWEHINKKECIRFCEVVYVNSLMNSITKKRISIDDEIRKQEFPIIIDRIKSYDSHLRNNTLPNAEPHNCNFCVYESICKTNSKGGQVDLISSSDTKLPNQPTTMVIDKPTEPKVNKGTEIKMDNHPKPDKNIKILL